jgi:hypothetical protein
MRKWFMVVAAGAAIAIAAIGLPAAGASTHASQTLRASSCSSHLPVRLGHFSGVIGAVPVDARCAHNTSDAARGAPPLIFHGGPMMGTPLTGPVVVTPIFWDPAGHTMTSSYKSIITDYLADVAADSGLHTNVYSTLNEYSGSNGTISYDIQLGAPIEDTRPLPASGCFLMRKDRSGIYADGSGYDACLDDAQVTAETDHMRATNGLPIDLAHIYVLFLPKHVESCFYGGPTAPGPRNACTINYEKTAAYCAYHNMASNGMVYANLPFPIYTSPVGYTCGSDARIAFQAIESPNGDPDADTEISPTSHEIMEAITDPDTVTGWYDQAGYENGDECAYVYGAPQGTPGAFYNQVINGDHYLTQEEFSNQDFFDTGLGCLQSE